MGSGIFGEDTDSNMDADVIVTAAALGYAHWRLTDTGKNCAFAAEVLQDCADDDKYPTLDFESLTRDIRGVERPIDNYGKFAVRSQALTDKYLNEAKQKVTEVADAAKGWILHKNAIGRINAALGISEESDIDDQQDGSERKMVMVDATPNFGDAGVIWVSGATGDLSLQNHNRYLESPHCSDLCGKLLGYIQGQHVSHGKGVPFAGYKGKGAYTGMSAREKGSAYLYSTFRGHPLEKYGTRWTGSDKKPTNSSEKSADSAEGSRRIHGVVGAKDAGQMKWLDTGDGAQSTDDGFLTGLVGYAHGMVQAVYDVKYAEKRFEDENPRKPVEQRICGTPYEIGFKESGTTKLASCFYCALFMEANGTPASSIHLGQALSWAPVYRGKDMVDANAHINEHFVKDFRQNFGMDGATGSAVGAAKLDETIKRCNNTWAQFCSIVLLQGIRIIAANRQALLEEDHYISFDALLRKLQGRLGQLEALKLSFKEKKIHRLVDEESANKEKEKEREQEEPLHPQSIDKELYEEANLLLDAATVHEKVAVRIVRTLRAPLKETTSGE